MKLENLSLLSLQTAHMRKDPTTQAFCHALDRQVQKLYTAAQRLSILSSIATQGDAVLDALAWQYHVDEYDANDPIEAKRGLVQRAILVHKYRGTAYACEEVTEAVFGAGSIIEEWFAYGGKPKHYRIHTDRPKLVADNYRQFLALIEKVGRVGVVLDAIRIGLYSKTAAYVGMAVHEQNYEIYTMGTGGEAYANHDT